MGQYFKAVNTDKREYVCPWCIGCGAKLWEWAANPQGAIFTLLLRKSDGTGGGDFYTAGPQAIRVPNGNPKEAARITADALRKAAKEEGRRVQPPEGSVVGRWAGDSVMLIGDYDSSHLWDELDSFRNISQELAWEWNAFIEVPDFQLDYAPCSACREPEQNVD